MGTVVAWDLKGTVVTGSEEARASAFNRYLEGAGYAGRVTPEQIERAGYGWRARMNTLTPDFTPTEKALETLDRLQREEIPKYVKTVPGALAALRSVGKKNSVIVSTSGRNLIAEYLRAAKLEGRFEKVYSVLDDALPAGIGRDMVLAEDIPAYKAVLFRRVVADFPRARVIAVGDRNGDRRAAREAGIDFVHAKDIDSIERTTELYFTRQLPIGVQAARA